MTFPHRKSRFCFKGDKMSQTLKKKENRRVRYTRLALRESLLAQMEKQPLNKITVTRVCETADVNRSTFYLYYKDVYDLMDSIQQELYEELDALVVKNSTILPSSDLLRRIYEVIYKNRDLARVVFGKYGDKELMKRITNIYRDQSIKEWKKLLQPLDAATLDYLYTFYTYTHIGVIEHWVTRNFHETPEQLAQLTNRLLTYGISPYISKG